MTNKVIAMTMDPGSRPPRPPRKKDCSNCHHRRDDRAGHQTCSWTFGPQKDAEHAFMSVRDCDGGKWHMPASVSMRISNFVERHHVKVNTTLAIAIVALYVWSFVNR